MTFGESISTCFRKYLVIQGRASKSEFWWFQLLWSASIFIMFIFEGSEPVTYFFIGIIVIIFIPLLTAGIRRLHDTGNSGWMLLVSIIPIIGGIWLFILSVIDSEPGENKWGPNPKTN